MLNSGLAVNIDCGLAPNFVKDANTVSFASVILKFYSHLTAKVPL